MQSSSGNRSTDRQGVASGPATARVAVARRRTACLAGIAAACLVFMIGASWSAQRRDDHRLRGFVAEVAARQSADRVCRPLYDDAELLATAALSDTPLAAGLQIVEAGGNGRAAVLRWLDDARWMRDAVHENAAADVVALFDRWSSTELAALDDSALQLLASGLERLDAEWPLHEDVAGWLAASAEFWLDKGLAHQPDAEQRLRAWRRGFIVRAEALVTCDLLLTRLPGLSPAAADWPARAQQWRVFLDDLSERCSGDVLWLMFHLAEVVEPTRFAALARLRLLRLSASFLLGEELPRLADPFATEPLQVEVRGNEATFRSVSTDPVLVQRATRR